MRNVDGFLSRRAQKIWPQALVFQEEDGGFVLYREADAQPLGLGKSFKEARQAIDALAAAHVPEELR